MDKLKYVKLENPDGSYTDPIALSADAQNVDMTSNGESINLANYIVKNDTDITRLKAQVDGIVDNSPIPVNSTAAMLDTSKIYVNTSDGYWYYYNGSAWTQGGVYQATEVGDDSITYKKLESELKVDYIPETEYTEAQPTTGYIINVSGNTISATGSHGYYELSVMPFESYKLRIHYTRNNDFGTNNVRYMFKNDNTVISYTTGASMVPIEGDNSWYEEIVDIPYNVNKLLINCNDSGTSYNRNIIAKIKKYKHINIEKTDLEQELQDLTIPVYTEITPTLMIDKCYINGSFTLNSYNTAQVYKIEVQPGEIYRINVKQLYANPTLFFGNSNGQITKTFNETSYTFNTYLDTLKSTTSNYIWTNYLITIPENCINLYVNKINNDSNFKFEKISSYKLNPDKIDFPEIPDFVQNPLNGKTLCFIGDSICAASTTGVKGWVNIMAENNPNANFYNYAHDGRSIAKATDELSVRSMQNDLPTILSEHPNTDYFIFQGGANDHWLSSHGITLGEISEGYNSDNLDLSTFCGGMEYIIKYVYTNFPGTKLVFIVTHQINSANFGSFMEKAILICKKWGVPYIDLFNEGNITFKFDILRTTYTLNSDGCHPNLAGYEIETPLIEKALKYRI